MTRMGDSTSMDLNAGLPIFNQEKMKDFKMQPISIYLTGGFLGSGKTTAIVNAGKQLIKQERKIGVIVNDQGDQQVDSDYLQSVAIPSAEVANGCFCCNYDALERKIQQLSDTGLPEIIFAESVGTCTDLVATIAKPFAVYHPEFRVVISVYADAALLGSIINGTSCFIEESVQYIYKKQLEEADIIIINKTDLLSDEELYPVRAEIERTYAGKTVLYQNSYSDNDIHKWLATLDEFSLLPSRKSLELDYDIYGAGEAALAWYDQRISIHTVPPVAVEAAMQLIQVIRQKIGQSGYTIGHLKFLLRDDDWVRKISYTASGHKNDWVHGEHACKHLSVLINARVQTSPSRLQQVINGAIQEIMMETGCRIVAEKENAFQPGYPRPMHRMMK